MGKVLNKIDKIRPLRREGDGDQVEPRTMQMYCQFSLRTITFDIRSVYKRHNLSRRCKALKYTMHNRFSNFLCFASFCAHLRAVPINFNCNVENRILGKWNHEFSDAILQIGIWGEQELQKGSESKNHTRCK